MDSTDRSKQGGVDDAKQSASALNFDASSLSSDGTTLKISHDDNAPKPTPEPEPAPQPAPESVSSPEPQPLDHPTQPIPPAQPTGVPVNPLARKAPTFIGNSQASRTAQFAQQTGDIMLQPTQPPKKSQKPLLIAIIIACIVIIVVVVVFLIFANPNSPLATSTTKLRPAFNQYANYALYGTESTNDLAEPYSESKTYQIASAITNSDDNSATIRDPAFFNSTQQKFNTFIQSYNNANIQNSELANLLSDYQDNFNFLTLYANTQRLNQNDIAQKYLAGNTTEQITSYIQKTYSPFIGSSLPLAQEYGQKAIIELQNSIALFDTMKTNDCIQGQTIEPECAQSTMKAFQSDKKQNDSSTIVVHDALQFIIQKCWDIDHQLGGQNV